MSYRVLRSEARRGPRARRLREPSVLCEYADCVLLYGVGHHSCGNSHDLLEDLVCPFLKYMMAPKASLTATQDLSPHHRDHYPLKQQKDTCRENHGYID